MRLVVLLVGPGSGEGDMLVLAIVLEMVVYELTTTIAVDAKQRKREPLSHGLNAFKSGFLALIGQGDRLCPAGVDIHHVERMQELSCRGIATMSHQVHLNEARELLVVRMGMAFLSRVPGLVVVRPRPANWLRARFRRR